MAGWRNETKIRTSKAFWDLTNAIIYLLCWFYLVLLSLAFNFTKWSFIRDLDWIFLWISTIEPIKTNINMQRYTCWAVNNCGTRFFRLQIKTGDHNFVVSCRRFQYKRIHFAMEWMWEIFCGFTIIKYSAAFHIEIIKFEGRTTILNGWMFILSFNDRI